MLGRIRCVGLLLYGCCFAALASVDTPKQTVRTISSGDMFQWSSGLLIVLAIFFLCIWGLRKLNGITFNNAEKMRVVGGLSLGLREKIVLLQVGKKQLVLGITPGRIDTLHVLEGDDCLNSSEPVTLGKDSKFSDIIMQVIKGRADG